MNEGSTAQMGRAVAPGRYVGEVGGGPPKRTGTIEAHLADLHVEANELEGVVTRLETVLANALAPGKEESKVGSAPLGGNCSIAQGVCSATNNVARSRNRLLELLDRLQIA